MNDPKRSNGLLFYADGRVKTLKERGLGWDDPPLVGAVVPKRAEVLRKLRAVTKNVVTKIPVTENRPVISVTNKRGRGRPRSEGSISAAERMRRMRERRKGEKDD